MNPYGYVINYSCCASIELAFYTTVVRMDREKLDDIHLQVNAIYNETDPGSEQNVKRFGIMVDKNTRLALTYAELKQLLNMINEAQLIMQAYDIIEVDNQ